MVPLVTCIVKWLVVSPFPFALLMYPFLMVFEMQQAYNCIAVCSGNFQVMAFFLSKMTWVNYDAL
jgi:hypothetical protein